MNCRKCGARRITRRSAGIFICRHCGVQPGPLKFDRFGNQPPPVEIPTSVALELPYEFAPLKRRLVASYKTKGASNET